MAGIEGNGKLCQLLQDGLNEDRELAVGLGKM